MKIIIVGSGDTGTHLAKMLSYENQDVTLMSPDKAYLTGLDSSYNIMVSVGDPVSCRDLKAIGVSGADLFVAVTPSGEANMISCELAKHLGAKGCIARAGTHEYEDAGIDELFRNAGIDMLVYPETLVAQDICAFIKRNWVTSWFELNTAELILAGVRIPEDAPISGFALRDKPADGMDYHVSAIRRGRKMIIPGGHDRVEPGDMAYFAFYPGDGDSIAAMSGHNSRKVRNIMIAGISPITDMLVSRLHHEYRITVVSPDIEKCRELAAEYSDIVVVNTEIKDISTLREESIDIMDMFIALDSNAETNIVACMVAKEFGVPLTVAQIEDIEYMPQAERMSIDKIVNKKLITSGMILRYIMGHNMRVESLLALEDVEMAEIEVKERARITRASVKDLGLPKELTIAGLIRDGRGMLVDGRTVMQPGDKVLVIFMPGAMHKVEKWFRN